jgi:predicted transcriptional regulator
MSTVEQTTGIIIAQLSAQPMSTDDICASIKSIHATLSSLEIKQDMPSPSPRDSIRKDSVICLECGRSFRLLSNKHLNMHGLTPRAYKIKYKIPLTQPLSSKMLTKMRRAQSKARGHGEALAAWRADRRQSA